MPSKGEYKDFKDALRDWTDRPPAKPAPPPAPPAPAIPHHIYQPGPSERVVGGNIIREPIDRVAARVVASAPWYYQPPDQPTRETERPVKRRHKKMKGDIQTKGEEVLGERNFIPGGPGQEGSVRSKLIGGEEFLNMDDMVVRIIDEINKSPQRLTPLARAALDARTVIDESMAHIGVSMDGFKENVTKFLQEIRTTRMNFVSEANYMLGPLKDIRQFFLESTYEIEVNRLREFVNLCERLQKLKDSGFLDTVADTMIRLATKAEE
jgi:hypothetical protein